MVGPVGAGGAIATIVVVPAAALVFRGAAGGGLVRVLAHAEIQAIKQSTASWAALCASLQVLGIDRPIKNELLQHSVDRVPGVNHFRLFKLYRLLL